MALKWLFGRSAKSHKTDPAPDYEDAKAIASSGDARERKRLARSTGLQPEFLYFFATDSARDVREAVAGNPMTPVQADAVLAKDKDPDVKIKLGEKIGRLLPDLSKESNQKLITLVMQVVDSLACDSEPRVRAALANQIRASDTIPPRIARRLAEDAEAIVSAPVLEFSPLLNDEDLLTIIAAGCGAESLSAISKRAALSAAVTQGVVATGDEAAVATLLSNQGAVVAAPVLEEIVETGASKPNWHGPLVGRADLTGGLMNRMAFYLSDLMLERLIENNVLVDQTLATELRGQRKEPTAPAGEKKRAQGDPDQQRAEALHAAGKLNATAMIKAARAQETEFIIHALALLSDAKTQDIRRLLSGTDPQLSVSLAWHCALGMEFASALQEGIVSVKGPLKPSKGETAPGYPMSESDMGWVLEVAGIL